MRIIGISGVWGYRNPVLWTMAEAFVAKYPGAWFVAEEEADCHPWQIGRLRRLTERIVEKYDDGTDVLFVGHSMGGVVACAAAQQFRHSRVRGVVTIFSPHEFLLGIFPALLGARGSVPAPLVTFAAWRDSLVLWGARHPHTHAHTVLDSNHFTNLVGNRELARRIADIASQRIEYEARDA